MFIHYSILFVKFFLIFVLVSFIKNFLLKHMKLWVEIQYNLGDKDFFDKSLENDGLCIYHLLDLLKYKGFIFQE